jgi:heme-degrading monooxygenase HmoA
VIARIWSAQTTREQAPVYADHLRRRVIPELKMLDGYAGAMLLERAASDPVEIVVITYWDSMDAVRAFAGPDPDHAVVAEEAAAVLISHDERVRHYAVVMEDGDRRVDRRERG